MKTFSLYRSKAGLVALLSIIYLQTSCLEAEEKPVNFGPEVSQLEIVTAMRGGMGKEDHNLIGYKEKSEKVFYAYITNNPKDDPMIIGVVNKEVQKKEKLADRWRYTSTVTTTYWENNQEKKKVDPDFRDEFALNGFEEPDEADKAFAQAFNNDSGVQTFNNGGTKITFHNLRVSEAMRDLPQKVKNKTNCADIPECKIKSRFINVIAAEWLPNGSVVRHDLQFIVTSQSPYFSRILGQCDTSLQKLQSGQSVLVTFCNSITDFEFGATWPTLAEETTP